MSNGYVFASFVDATGEHLAVELGSVATVTKSTESSIAAAAGVGRPKPVGPHSTILLKLGMCVIVRGAVSDVLEQFARDAETLA